MGSRKYFGDGTLQVGRKHESYLASCEYERAMDLSLHTAARNNDILKCKEILTKKNINSKDKYCRTPLHIASWAGHEDFVSMLLSAKANASANATDKKKPIHFAAEKGHVQIVELLIANGAANDVNAVLRKNLKTPLHMAAQKRHANVVKLLLEHGADTRMRTSIKTGAKRPYQLCEINSELRALLQPNDKVVEGGVPSNSGTSFLQFKQVGVGGSGGVGGFAKAPILKTKMSTDRKRHLFSATDDETTTKKLRRSKAQRLRERTSLLDLM